MLNKQLEEEFILICRGCLPKICSIGGVSQILPYVDLMDASYRKAFQMCYKDEIELAGACSGITTAKKQKLSENES